MAEQIPLPAKAHSGLPAVSIDDGALLKFSREINMRLKDFEQRFVKPRQHPRIIFGQARGTSRRPR